MTDNTILLLQLEKYLALKLVMKRNRTISSCMNNVRSRCQYYEKDAHIIKDIEASMLSMVWRESPNTLETNTKGDYSSMKGKLVPQFSSIKC